MAFGFRRLSGRARNYEAVDAEGYAPGTVLSRRQYDAYVSRLGRRERLPGFDLIREAERRLEALQARLEAAERAAQSEFEREAVTQAREAARREGAATAQAKLRRSRQQAGQRRYNSLLKSFREERARQGRPISFREARVNAEFRQIVADMKGKANPKGDPNIADDNRSRRMKALDRLGGDRVFREQYAALYGRVVDVVTNARGERFNRVMLPNGRSVIVKPRRAA